MKYKTIKISEEMHEKIKKYCDVENLKINKWCETQLDIGLAYVKATTAKKVPITD